MKRIACLLLAAALIASAGTASAQVYLSEGFTILSPSVGYRFSKYFAAEVGAFKAKEDDRMSSSGVAVTNGSNVTERQEIWNISGYRLLAIGTFELGHDIYALGRVGFYRLKGTFEDNATTTFRSSVNGVPSAVLGRTTSKRYEESTDAGFGLGFEWRFDRHVNARVFYEQVNTDLGFDGKLKLSTVELMWVF